MLTWLIIRVRSIQRIEHPDMWEPLHGCLVFSDLIKYDLRRAPYILVFFGVWGIEKAGLVGF